MSPRKKKVPEEETPKMDTTAINEEQLDSPADATSGHDPPKNSDASQTDPGLKVQPRRKDNQPAQKTLTIEPAVVAFESSTKNNERRRILLPGDDVDVLTIDDELGLATESEQTRDAILDLIESLRTGRYLTDYIQGVEWGTGTMEPRAILFHGTYKVVIMASMVVALPSELRDFTPNEMYHYMLTKRMGAEIDYVIKGIDPNTGIAVGDRSAATATKRHHFFLTPDKEGLYRTYEGQIAEARVLATTNSGIYLEVFGVDVWCPISELSYSRIESVDHYFRPGDRVLVRITKLTREEPDRIWLNVSVKRVRADPRAKALERLQIGNTYSGICVMLDEAGIYVRLDIGAVCRCKYPQRGRPIKGSRVAVKILGMDEEKLICWGLITYVAIPR